MKKSAWNAELQDYACVCMYVLVYIRVYVCVCTYTHMLYVCIAVVHSSLLWAYVSPSTHAPLVYSRQSRAICVHTTPSVQSFFLENPWYHICCQPHIVVTEWYDGGGCVVKTF